ncbi:MAG: response regulator [Thermodesulfobacteriota bacterium]
MKISLQHKVNAAILTTFLLIAVIYIAIQFPFHKHSMKSVIRQKEILLRSVVERDQEHLANEIFESRKRAIVIRLRQMSQVEGILSIRVYDRSGKFMAAADAQAHQADLSAHERPRAPETVTIYQDDTAGVRTLVYTQTIEVIHERIGFIRILYSLDEVQQQRRLSYLIFGGLLAAILVIMLVLLNWILSRVVIQPIHTLRMAMLRMKSGALGDQVEVKSGDEIGDLTMTFNRMSADLAGSYEQIENQNRYLRESEKLLSDESERLAQMRIYLKNIIDSMPSMLISVNQEGVVVEWNEAACRATGIPATEAVGREIWQVYPVMEKYRDSIREVFNDRSPKEFHREPAGSGDSETFHHITIFPLIANCVQGIVIRVDNITELEKKEQQLRHAQKMETIGTLAGGLAHDFNNILGGITGSLSLIHFRLSQQADVEKEFLTKHIGLMGAACRRASELVNQLLSIARKQEMNFEPVDLNATIDHVMKICANSLDKCIELDGRPYPGKAMIHASPTQTEQVLLNLCVNAAHAMTTMRKPGERQGGKLTVAIEAIYADDKFRVTHPEAKPIRYWVLSVQDTGVGMDTKTVAKIFDPFFTTKEKEKGTGLGLAMVYNIVHQIGGFIDVYTEVGLGSTFNVYIPELEEARMGGKARPEVEMVAGQGLVLIVDDEEMIRNTAGEMLEICGYSVILAADGEEALTIFRKRHQEISVILLDMIMPKKSGKETYLEMKKITPDLKVLFSSGFKQDERVEEVLRLGVQGFVQKPYSLQVLSGAIHRVIHS